MAEGPVAFIDSGIGGLPYLSFTRRLLPDERFIYAADRGNFPYGNKQPKEIIAAALSLTAGLLEREAPRLIVVACNTMSVVSLSQLRSRFTVPFIGVVPAVKPAAAISSRKSVGILATVRTIEGEYLKELIGRFAGGCRVESITAADLVDFVELQLFKASEEEKRAHVRQEAVKLRSAGVDTVVLGCTHFLHLEEEFKEELGEGIRIVDSREGVAKRILSLLGEGAAGKRDAQRGDSLYLSGRSPIEERYRYFARKFGLHWEGTL
jgi:glutamate racemase